MVKLRKGPVCRGTLADGSSCEARVERLGERCHVCLERLATGTDVEARRALAHDTDLPVQLFDLLGDDADDDVRLSIALREDCPLVVLQRLEHDAHPEVRSAANIGLSSALTPRVLQERGRGNLFTRAELEALGPGDAVGVADLFGPPVAAVSGPPRPAGRDAGPPEPSSTGAAVARPAATRIRRVTSAGEVVAPSGADPGASSGIEAILARLDGLGERLNALEAVLSATGDRIGAVTDRLEHLAEIGDSQGRHAARRLQTATHPAERAGEPAAPAVATEPTEPPAPAERAPVPIGGPAELDTGPVIRPEVVAAAWLSVIPLLARRLGPGLRVAPPSGVGEALSGPLLAPMPGGVAELAAAPPGALGAEDTVVVVTDAPLSVRFPVDAAAAPAALVDERRRVVEPDRRHRQAHARRRGSR